ncbi:O-antigen ligase family protein [Sphingomonas mollis]|uniref:O-antigen ligase family protein n=1 Tax=Sphingomonas mollis TaxID=2795726 RepID=A0ABS0XTH0_9SPHN|nr:O-antigen ligase family protein [Sphingomonas sp. BT553]MBJ6123336.1 O-antigen ligase family protein [Sphingomonas sp. BT553]
MLAVIVMMVFGGPIPSIVATILIGIAGLLLLGALTVSDERTALQNQPLAFRIGLAGVALLPLLQIVPLPPSIWHMLPGQELRVRMLTLAGLADSWQPLSVTPLFTAGTVVIAIAFVALVTLLLVLPAKDFRRVVWLIFGLIGLNILIGLVQVASGGQVLRFHTAADHGALLGFYANKNHAALVLAASLPIAAYLFGSRVQPQGARTWLGFYAGIVLVALVTTNSRAGIGLGVMAVLLLGSLYVRAIKPIYIAGIVAVVVGGIILVSTSSAFEQVFSRFNAVDEDLRWQFLRTSRPLIERYWLFGSGIGSFSTLYAVGENLAWVKPTFVNQLHNEYPQLLLETGLPGVGIFLMMIGGLIWRGVGVWRQAEYDNRLPLLCGALILVLIAVHSGVDYPLRRPAVLPILALAMILVIRGDLTASTGLVRRRQRT